MGPTSSWGSIPCPEASPLKAQEPYERSSPERAGKQLTVPNQRCLLFWLYIFQRFIFRTSKFTLDWQKKKIHSVDWSIFSDRPFTNLNCIPICSRTCDRQKIPTSKYSALAPLADSLHEVEQIQFSNKSSLKFLCSSVFSLPF